MESEIKHKVILLGKEAEIEQIGADAADSRSPWKKEDEIVVWLSFRNTVGHVGGTVSFAITLPVNKYKPDEFLKLVQWEGERYLKKSLAKSERDRLDREAREARQKELDKLATRLRNLLSV